MSIISEDLNKKSILEDLLSQCTDKQLRFFGIVFSKGISEINIDYAISLCQRTIDKNIAKGR
jgi:hypothetical protein